MLHLSQLLNHLNYKLQTEEMEVHHPHHVTHKKNWKEYLLEFFMLFLAVFLGFIAENIRENIGNHEREKEYIQSMLQDLQSDTTNLAKAITVYEKKDKLFDTVFMLYPTLTSTNNLTLIKSISRIRGYPDFVYTDRTIQQLKSSGGMSLIRNQKAANAITEYDVNMRKLDEDMNVLIQFFGDVARSWREIFDNEAITQYGARPDTALNKERKNYLLKNDRETLGRFYNELKDFKSSSDFIKQQEESLKKRAENLMMLLQKEYHLDNKQNKKSEG
jgi:hypothetical protein